MKKRKKAPSKKGLRKKKKRNSFKLFFVFAISAIGITAYFFFWYKVDNHVQKASEFHKIIPKNYKSIGLDVSHHQGEIDWDFLLHEKGFDTIIDFVYCKVTEGTDHTDTQWERNRSYLNKHGILNGAYHYFKPFKSPNAQVKHFLNNYRIRSIDLPPVIDVEEEGESDEKLIQAVRTWCELVRKETGIRPIIYTSLHFYKTKFRGKIKGYNYWLAAYSKEPEYMTDKEVLHWQFSESARLPGIDEFVDLNVSKIAF